jgi:hypothetical protein
VVDGFDDDVCDPLGYLVRQEEHAARDGHQMRVRTLFERAALFIGQPTVARLGVNHPRRHAGSAQPLGRTFVAMQPLHVLAQPLPIRPEVRQSK